MKTIDILILILLCPALAMFCGYYYMQVNELCPPIGPLHCIGVHWVVDVVVIPITILSTSLALFFLSKRFKTERL